MTLEFMFIVVLPLLLSLALTPRMISLATRVGAIDRPEERKIHTTPIPRLGGVVVFTSLFVSLALESIVVPGFSVAASANHYNWYFIIASLLLVLSLGILDDLHSLKAGKKFIVQMMVGTLVYLAGVRISHVSIPFGAQGVDIGFLSFPATVFWVVGITNAFNLIDGLDGLASGVAMIASLTIFVISFLGHDILTEVIALTLAGAVLGFLPFNFNPARIFLGDSGSLVLGFVLGVLSIHSSTKGSTAFSILVAVLTLGLPIMDTLLAMLRRLLRSFLPSESTSGSVKGRLKKMFLPDRRHIHHQLLAQGFSHRRVVIILYVVSCALGFCSCAATMGNASAVAMMILIGVGAVIGIRKLGYREMALVRNGLLLSLYDAPMMSRGLFYRCVDVAFIVGSYSCAYMLASSGWFGSPLTYGYPLGVVLASAVQICVFSLGRLYKSTYRSVIGVGDVLEIVRTTIIAVALSALLSYPFNHFETGIQLMTLWVLDFYFLLSLVVGIRASFHVLTFLFRRNAEDGRRLLIYGAGTFGVIALQKVIDNKSSAFTPVGFLDDNPELEGKYINGYQVYGGYRKFEALVRGMSIQEIILSTEKMKPEAVSHIREVAKVYGVSVRTAIFQLEQFDNDLSASSPGGWYNARPELVGDLRVKSRKGEQELVESAG